MLCFCVGLHNGEMEKCREIIDTTMRQFGGLQDPLIRFSKVKTPVTFKNGESKALVMERPAGLQDYELEEFKDLLRRRIAYLIIIMSESITEAEYVRSQNLKQTT